MLERLRSSRLANGIHVVSYEIPDAEEVKFYILLRVGGRNESAELSGASHFIEHMFFKGTPRRNAKEISQAIESLGGYANAATACETTVLYAKVPYEKAGVAVDVLADLLYNASFDPKELASERDVILSEIQMCDDQPDQVAFEANHAQLWPNHPLGRPIAGTAESVQTLTRSALLAHLKRHYIPANTLFAFSGRIDHDTCRRLVAPYAAKKRNPRILPQPVPFDSAAPHVPLQVIERDVRQTQLVFGWRTPGTDDLRENAILRVLSALLGATSMSRLFQSVRERRGLCYAISSSCISRRDTGAFLISTGCFPEKARLCAKAIADEVRRLRERPVPAAELRRTLDYCRGSFRLHVDMFWAAGRLLAGLPADPVAELEKLNAVTAADLQEAARRYLTPERLALTVLTPKDAGHGPDVWQPLFRH